MSTLSYYDILCLDSKCTVEELKKAYRKMALLYHPDKNPNGLAAFQLITKAHRCLSDPGKRLRYDEKLERRRQADRAPKKCADTFFQLRVPLMDFYTGMSRTLSVEREELCERCKSPNECKTCGGKGTVTARKTLHVEIDKGLPDGHKIVFLGEGDSKPGCDPGDVIIELIEMKDPAYKRYGSCLCMEVDLFLEEALCGFKKTIKTPDCRELIISPERGATTPDGTIRYVENEGMPLRVGSTERGRLILKFNVHWPAVLDDRTIGRLSRILRRTPEETNLTGARVTSLEVSQEMLSFYEKMFEKE